MEFDAPEPKANTETAQRGTTAQAMYPGQKLLIANRGEIAVRIIRTAQEMGLPTVAIYTPSDALAPHVTLADEAVALPLQGTDSELKAYTNGAAITAACRAHGATLLHPGYGLLSENAAFAALVGRAGVTWLGPRPDVVAVMGRKHEARDVAVRAGLRVVPGSAGVVGGVAEAAVVARRVGFPIILKPTAGGGGIGMVICQNEGELGEKFEVARDRARVLFDDEGLILERYFPLALHIEIQIFGNGRGDVVHMWERDCSIQRRHQKIIEETPSPFFDRHPGLREKMCDAAVRLCRSVKYGSAGTVEFLVDAGTANFYFLEMNTRIQVEHTVTEATHPGLDIVKLMIEQGIAERQNIDSKGIERNSPAMQQSTYDELRRRGQEGICTYAIEGRVYAENPSEGFMPSPGLLQYVELNSAGYDWLRVESWVSTGISVTPFFDALLCKLIVIGRTREQAIARFKKALDGCKIRGPPNNIQYLKAVASSEVFCAGRATTQLLNTFAFTPSDMKILSPGIECTIQDLPGRTVGLGIPRSGPVDPLALRAGNALVGNPGTMEGLEIVAVPGVGFSATFYIAAVVAVTGKAVFVTIDGGLVGMWTRFVVPAGGKLQLDVDTQSEAPATGWRVYLSIRGGFPEVPAYLGSKSTSVGLGGYQGRPLLAGDQLALAETAPARDDGPGPVPRPVVGPTYPLDWIVYVLPGPHDDPEFITPEGIDAFYATQWRVNPSSNRMGIRLESAEAIQWARANGEEGGSHPSNILDNSYAPGTVNLNGDTPVILANEGPNMGGYLCLCTVASADLWKLGQLNAGSTVRFRRVTWSDSQRLRAHNSRWLSAVEASSNLPQLEPNLYHMDLEDTPRSPILHVAGGGDSKIVFRQAGDSAILAEFGPVRLDLVSRARIHAFESIINGTNIHGLLSLSPCIRSVLCSYDPDLITQRQFLAKLVAAQEALPDSVTSMQFPGRRLTFPIVLDDPWNRDALVRYMRTIRQKAVYLPSNIEYLANNNGLAGGSQEVLQKIVASDWLVLGVGFYMACPFLVPIDPRCRLVGQKMNPSRTYTPRGAVGIAGPVAAIYPVESPGGYQLFGRTLPTWQTWGKGKDFAPDRPWLLQPFDRVRFEPITEQEYIKLEKDFDAGQYSFKIEPATFSMAEYAVFLDSIADELAVFRKRKEEGSAREEVREQQILREWESEKQAGRLEAREAYQDGSQSDGYTTITASLFASVCKIKFRPGDVISSADDVLLILEAMKTEIPICGGEGNLGRTIKSLGKGIKEEAIVRPGDVLFVLV